MARHATALAIRQDYQLTTAIAAATASELGIRLPRSETLALWLCHSSGRIDVLAVRQDGKSRMFTLVPRAFLGVGLAWMFPAETSSIDRFPIENREALRVTAMTWTQVP